MSVQAPGERFSVVATKQVRHKRPVVEARHPGIALKSSQPPPMVPTVANATAAETILVGEELVIAMTGSWPVETALLPGGAVVGDPLYIVLADNTLANAANALAAGLVKATHLKFGVIDSIDTVLGLAMVNLNLRDTL